MKKHLILFLTILLIIIVIVCVNIIQNQNIKKQLTEFNAEYEKYTNTVIYGTDIATLINKAIDNNNKNNISKDEKGLYQDNGQDSILIDIIMITDEENQETTTYRMENIEKVGITQFISNFSLTTFKSSNVEYHQSTGKIAKITFEQLESISY